MKKYVCTVCGYIAEGEIPAQCPVCKAPASAFVEKTGNTADEVLSAANALAAAKVDAVFTPTDNTIMNSAAAVGEIFAETGIPHYTGADSFVRNGA